MLFWIGGALGTPDDIDPRRFGIRQVTEEDILSLERDIDEMTRELAPLTSFILCSGDQLVSFAHIVRAVCRRAERTVVALHEAEPLDPLIITYINRLSDYLFTLARYITMCLGKKEIKMSSQDRKSDDASSE